MKFGRGNLLVCILDRKPGGVRSRHLHAKKGCCGSMLLPAEQRMIACVSERIRRTAILCRRCKHANEEKPHIAAWFTYTPVKLF